MEQESALSNLRNIGITVEKRLNAIGIHSREELASMGSAEAYRKLSCINPGRHFPYCYYLYSLEGALQERHWDDFSEHEKVLMKQAVEKDA